MEPIRFRRWSNRRSAVLSTFHKVIHIGTLSLSYSLLQLQPVLAQSDTTSPALFYHLEEVEAIGEQEAELYSPQLRQLLLIQQEQLELVSSRSIPDLLDHIPGVDIRTRGQKGIQSDLSIQGGTFDQSLVLLNGIDMSDPQTGHFSLNLPVASSHIHRLEILKGPASRKYGLNAYSGAVNVVTRPADSLSLQAAAAYGQWNTFNGNAAIHVPLGTANTMIAAGVSGSDGYMENTGFRGNHVYMHTAFVGARLDADLMLGWLQKSFGANAFYTPRYPEQYEETSGYLGALKFSTKKNGIKYHGDIHWKRHFDHFMLFRSNPAAYENHHMTDVAGGGLGMRFSSGAGITTVDLRYRHDRIFSTTLGEVLAPERKVGGTEDTYYDRFKSRDHLSLSAGHLLKVNRWYINAGMMAHAGIRGLVQPGLYPGLDVSYRISESLDLFLSMNRSMRLPTFTDLYYQGPQNRGNADLNPEKAYTFESGIRWDSDLFRADLAGFYRAGEETIDWIWEDSMWQTRNFTDLHTFGFETNIVMLPKALSMAGRWVEHFSVGYSYTEISKGNQDVISNYVLDFLKHKLSFDVRLDLPGPVYLDAKLQRQDRAGSYLYYETPDASPVNTPYAPFWLLDLQVGLELGRFTFYVDATNLLNVSYRDIGSVPMPGRWIMTGVRYR